MADDDGTIPVRQPIDLSAVGRYFERHVAGYAGGEPACKQFNAGMSNPTYLLWSAAAPATRYVLRKKPPGKLLPSAHKVEREYKVMKALQGSRVPVPPVYALCEDESVLGTTFYVMGYVPGRVLTDNALPDFSADERRRLWSQLAEILAELHRVDYKAVGLTKFGREGGYVGRQLNTWSGQVRAVDSAPDSVVQRSLKGGYDPAQFAEVTEYLRARLPRSEPTHLIHGDFRLGNCIIHPTEARVVAVLDWEISTLGHPLVDLAYLAGPWDNIGRKGNRAGAQGIPFVPPGMPSLREFLDIYCRFRGVPPVSDGDFRFYVAFNRWRSCAIMHGVYARGLQGNAGSSEAVEFGDQVVSALARARDPPYGELPLPGKL